MIPQVVAKFEKGLSYLPWFTKYYSGIYSEVVRREIELASVTRTDRVLNIGCGAVPFTARLLVEQTGCSVTAIDGDSFALKKARKQVERWDLNGKINLFQGLGHEIKFSDFDVSIVALQAAPKLAIFDNLVDLSAGRKRLVFRCPSSDFKAYYDNIPSTPSPAACVEQSMKTFDRSVLYLTAA